MGTSDHAVEACLTAETKILLAQKLLTEDARPETVEQCVAELGEAAGLLGELARNPGGLDAEASVLLRRIQTAAARVHLQIEHASQLCLGWMQSRLGTGYTAQGSPILNPREAETLFEV